MTFVQLARKHGAGGGRHTDAVEELKNAFELAERSSPGITNRFCRIVDGFYFKSRKNFKTFVKLSLFQACGTGAVSVAAGSV